MADAPNTTPIDIPLEMSPTTAKRLAWAAWTLVLIGTVAGGYAALGWAYAQVGAGVGTLCMLLAAEIRRRLPSAKAINDSVKTGTSALLVLILAGAVASAGCPNAYRAGWVATASTVDARDAVDDGLSKAFSASVKDCVAKHGSKTEQYKTCIEGSKIYPVMAQWRIYAIPSINSAVASAKAILEIAEKTQASKDSATTKVLSAIKDAACAILAVAQQWRDLMPDQAKAAMAYVDAISGLACPTGGGK